MSLDYKTTFDKTRVFCDRCSQTTRYIDLDKEEGYEEWHAKLDAELAQDCPHCEKLRVFFGEHYETMMDIVDTAVRKLHKELTYVDPDD